MKLYEANFLLDPNLVSKDWPGLEKTIQDLLTKYGAQVQYSERWPDRRLEAATRHVVFDLVCTWMVPLGTTLESLREVWGIGRRTGDVEYASYAAHGYVHNSIYAGRPLEALLGEALALGAEMRALGQVNALHVHTPFEQLLKCLTGRRPDPSRLDDAEAMMRVGRYAEARGMYVAVLADRGEPTEADRALLGLARLALDPRNPDGDERQAAACLDRLLAEYPESRWAPEARTWRSLLASVERLQRDVRRQQQELKRLRRDVRHEQQETARLRQERERLRQMDLELERLVRMIPTRSP